MKFYDELTKTAVFTTVRELLHGINSMSTRKVDEHSGHLTLRGLRFVDVEGVTLSYLNPIEIFTGLKTDFNIPVHVAGCTRRGKVFRIKMTDHPTIETSAMQQKVAVVIEQAVVDIVEPLITIDDSVAIEGLLTEGTLPAEQSHEGQLTEEQPTIDWDWINSLQNKKYDKEALDKWCEKELSIKLNKRNTIENMIIDLKTQLNLI